MKGFVFCSGSQQFANLPFLFLELMDEAFLIFFIQAGKSFQELHPLQDASPASHCPQAVSPFSTCEVEYTSRPTRTLTRPPAVAPGAGTHAQAALGFSLSSCQHCHTLFVFFFHLGFLRFFSSFLPSFLLSLLPFSWIDYVFYFIAACFYAAFLLYSVGSIVSLCGGEGSERMQLNSAHVARGSWSWVIF